MIAATETTQATAPDIEAVMPDTMTTLDISALGLSITDCPLFSQALSSLIQIEVAHSQIEDEASLAFAVSQKATADAWAALTAIVNTHLAQKALAVLGASA